MRGSELVGKLVSAGLLCVFVLMGLGCGSWAQLGESEAEGARRHKRVARINRQELNADIDKFWLMDKPSKLTDKRIP